MECPLCGDDITMAQRAQGRTIMVPVDEPVYRAHTECYHNFIDRARKHLHPDDELAHYIRQLERAGRL